MSAMPAPSSATAPLRALVVDDAPELRLLLEPLLTREGFEVQTAPDGDAAIELTRSFRPDVIILDLMMPGTDGIEACRRIRTFSDAYVLMLTAKDAEMDRVIGLSVGADDYVAKPFSPHEVVARVRAMLRRPRNISMAATPAPVPSPTAPVIITDLLSRNIKRFGDLVMDLDAREVTINDEPVDLTRIEFELLTCLSTRPRMVFSRQQLLEMVWGPNWFGDTHVVDVHMSNLRRKLGDRGRSTRFIQTVRGIGFRLGEELSRR
jgi:DNA-binding response OmpR family regulator